MTAEKFSPQNLHVKSIGSHRVFENVTVPTQSGSMVVRVILVDNCLYDGTTGSLFWIGNEKMGENIPIRDQISRRVKILSGVALNPDDPNAEIEDYVGLYLERHNVIIDNEGF